MFDPDHNLDYELNSLVSKRRDLQDLINVYNIKLRNVNNKISLAEEKIRFAKTHSE